MPIPKRATGINKPLNFERLQRHCNKPHNFQSIRVIFPKSIRTFSV